MKAPTTNASVLCRASHPDHGVAFQKYSPSLGKWCWDYVGASARGKVFDKASVLYQLRADRCGDLHYTQGWYRYVLVTWRRRKGGWHGSIQKASPPVHWPSERAGRRIRLTAKPVRKPRKRAGYYDTLVSDILPKSSGVLIFPAGHAMGLKPEDFEKGGALESEGLMLQKMLEEQRRFLEGLIAKRRSKR